MLSSLFEFIEFQPRCGELCVGVITRDTCDICKLLGPLTNETFRYKIIKKEICQDKHTYKTVTYI